MEFIL